MSALIRVSDAATLGLHATALLAGASEPLTVRDIASALGVSANHLAKVMQRLVRAGIVAGRRGPRGGFALTNKAERISLRAVYEAVEGTLAFTHCLLGQPVCRGTCPLGGLLREQNRVLTQALEKTTVAVFARRWGGPRASDARRRTRHAT